MHTTIINARDTNSYANAVADVAAALATGALAVFPTETVYGVAASALRPDAIARLRAAKGRIDTQPFTVHVGQRAHARLYLSAPSALVRRFARKAWPGPLTLLCEEPHPAATDVARRCPPEQLSVIYQNGLVGLRCPDHPAAARLFADPAVPCVASSANRHGNAPPLEFHDALRDLGSAVEYAVDAGRTRFNTPSTIVEIRGDEWKLVRPGAIDERVLERMAWSEILFVCTGNSCRSPMAEYLFRSELAARLGVPVEQLAARGYRVLSAGVSALRGGLASPGAVEEMQRRGIDLTPHRSQPATPELLHRAEKIYVMSPEHRAAVLATAPAAATRVALLDPAGAIADPYGQSDAEYRRSADHIQRALRARLEEFVDEDRNW